MGEVVNLRLARKRRERAAAAVEASENRIRHGRTLADRTEDQARQEQETRRHQGHRLTSRPDDETDGPEA